MDLHHRNETLRSEIRGQEIRAQNALAHGEAIMSRIHQEAYTSVLQSNAEAESLRLALTSETSQQEHEAFALNAARSRISQLEESAQQTDAAHNSISLQSGQLRTSLTSAESTNQALSAELEQLRTQLAQATAIHRQDGALSDGTTQGSSQGDADRAEVQFLRNELLQEESAYRHQSNDLHVT